MIRLEKLSAEMAEVIDLYLQSVQDETTGEAWTSHSGANYVYWSNDQDRQGATSYKVDSQDLLNAGLIYADNSGIDLDGPDGWVHLPMSFDIGKIRRRIEDALRKTSEKGLLLKFAGLLNCKLS